MTRFMMTLEDAVELVLYAFVNGRNGDIFVQKAPAASVAVLARALLDVLGKPDHEIREIGTRHGEKQFEVLLSREEMAAAEDLGAYYRVPPDGRDLNYAKFVDQGERAITASEDYNSRNTQQLDVPAMAQMLRKLDLIERLQRGDPVGAPD